MKKNGRGLLVVISAPSGAGKSSICRGVLDRNPDYLFSVSCTTRPKRLYESNGNHYYFVTKSEFIQKIENGEFVEWEIIHGYYYGTLVSEVEKALKKNRVMLFDIDVKGGVKIKKRFKEQTLAIFVEPPSINELKNRLLKRGSETKNEIEKRMQRVTIEMGYAREFDHRVINDDLNRAINRVDQVIKRHLMKRRK
jgi:guanylate kinase